MPKAKKKSGDPPTDASLARAIKLHLAKRDAGKAALRRLGGGQGQVSRLATSATEGRVGGGWL